MSGKKQMTERMKRDIKQYGIKRTRGNKEARKGKEKLRKKTEQRRKIVDMLGNEQNHVRKDETIQYGLSECKIRMR